MLGFVVMLMMIKIVMVALVFVMLGDVCGMFQILQCFNPWMLEGYYNFELLDAGGILRL